MKRTAAGVALVLSLLVGAPAVASAATTAPAVPAAVVVPMQDDGNSEPPPPTGGEEEPPPPTTPTWRDRVNAAFDRAISRVQANPRIPDRQKQPVVRILQRIQTRWR